MAGSATDAPYWGPIDAAHQFCEGKYAVSPYVAEFCNTFSNVPCYIIPGLFGLYRATALGYCLRMKLLWCTFILVGIGSFLFHLTMRFHWELLDEIPMYMLVLAGTISKDDTHWLTQGTCKLLVHLGIFTTSIVTLGFYIATGNYEIFVNGFLAVVLMDAVVCWVCTGKPDKHGSRSSRGCFLAYAGILITAKVFWEIEVQTCPAGSNGPLAWLHVLWHALSGLAVYIGILGDSQVRYGALGLGRAVDDPQDPWPLIWIARAWQRPRSDNGCNKRE